MRGDYPEIRRHQIHFIDETDLLNTDFKHKETFFSTLAFNPDPTEILQEGPFISTATSMAMA
jgi:hypothetical protein